MDKERNCKPKNKELGIRKKRVRIGYLKKERKWWTKRELGMNNGKERMRGKWYFEKIRKIKNVLENKKD